MFRVLAIVCATSAVDGIVVNDATPFERYNYAYEVADPSTSGSKQHQEVRIGEFVTGHYSVLDPDGTYRTVHYTADPFRGFQAVISNQRSDSTPESYARTYDANIPHNIEASSLTSRQSSPTSSIEKKGPVFFTPADELKAETVVFLPGQHFLPNINH